MMHIAPREYRDKRQAAVVRKCANGLSDCQPFHDCKTCMSKEAHESRKCRDIMATIQLGQGTATSRDVKQVSKRQVLIDLAPISCGLIRIKDTLHFTKIRNK